VSKPSKDAVVIRVAEPAGPNRSGHRRCGRTVGQLSHALAQRVAVTILLEGLNHPGRSVQPFPGRRFVIAGRRFEKASPLHVVCRQSSCRRLETTAPCRWC